MSSLIHEIQTAHTPETLVQQLHGESGLMLLRSARFDSAAARYSFVVARPFLVFCSFGSRCEIIDLVAADVNLRTPDAAAPPHNPPFHNGGYVQFGNPWHILDSLMSRYELLDEADQPFPLGGAFGYWGYDLKNFVEPRLPRRAVNDLELPDCHVGFYASLVVFDHRLGKTWIVATGLAADGSRSETRAREQLKFWREKLSEESARTLTPTLSRPTGEGEPFTVPQNFEPRDLSNAHPSHREPSLAVPLTHPMGEGSGVRASVTSNFTRADFLAAVARAQRYIRAGDIYQVNLSQRLSAPCADSGWELFQRLSAVSPAPFAAFLDCGDFQIASSSPELFLRVSGAHILTRPIKGTRPRDAEPTRDAQLAYELQTSAKELAELVMITDLLRNDLGKVCEYGSVQVPELAKLEKFAQVQHLVSTVEGRLRNDVTHFAAFASCFPGGSITGAPKIRAMEIIDELEPITRGPYTGALGYLGFNRESQLSIIIRAAVCKNKLAHFHVGAGIVADSVPEAEYDETLAKAAGFLAALNLESANYANLREGKNQFASIREISG